MSHAISLAFLTVFDIGPLEAIRVAAAAGYDMVGVRLLPAAAAGEPDYPLLTDDALLADVKRALADHAIRVGDVEIIRLKPERSTGSATAVRPWVPVTYLSRVTTRTGRD